MAHRLFGPTHAGGRREDGLEDPDVSAGPRYSPCGPSTAPQSRLDAPEDVVLDCGRPVLIVPKVSTPPRVEGNLLISWNGSREAMRAVQDASPVMGLYDAVIVLSSIPTEDADIELQTKLIDHLAGHGLNDVPETTKTASGAVANTMLGRAAELDAGAIVMGAYGHSRLRETILGGVTRDMLLDTSRPLLMSH